MKLSALLNIRPGITALAGSGGKTTAMYLLARELQSYGTVLCTTTTHIFPPVHIPTASSLIELKFLLRRHRCVCVGAPASNGKLTAPQFPLSSLTSQADYILAEADGSKGLPLKAHLPHEPVIPSQANQTILLAGASGFGRPVQEAVHRPERFCQIAEIPPDAPVTVSKLAAVLFRERLADQIFINQVETPETLEQARQLAALLPWPVYAGSLKGGIWKCLS